MIDRIFGHQDIPSMVQFDHPRMGSVRANVVKISHSKAILNTTVRLNQDEVLAVMLSLPQEMTLRLQCSVVDSGRHGLFVRWIHPNKYSLDLVASVLVQAASWYQDSRTKLAATTAKSTIQDFADMYETPGDGGPDLSNVPDALRSTILNRARTIRSTDLAARQSSVQVLGVSTIANLIQEAVQDAIDHSSRNFTANERNAVLAETEQNLKDGLAQLRAEKEGVESQATSLRQQLADARSLLEEERERATGPDPGTVPAAGKEELERRLGQLLDRSARAAGIDAEVEGEMRTVVSRILDDECHAWLGRTAEARNDALALLERKVERLAHTLEAACRARDQAEQRACALEASGVTIGGSVYSVGIDDHDPNKQKKLGLLRDLAQDNREVRAHMAAVRQSAGREQEAAGRIKKIRVEEAVPPPLERTRE